MLYMIYLLSIYVTELINQCTTSYSAIVFFWATVSGNSSSALDTAHKDHSFKSSNYLQLCSFE